MNLLKLNLKHQSQLIILLAQCNVFVQRILKEKNTFMVLLQQTTKMLKYN